MCDGAQAKSCAFYAAFGCLMEEAYSRAATAGGNCFSKRTISVQVYPHSRLTAARTFQCRRYRSLRVSPRRKHVILLDLMSADQPKRFQCGFELLDGVTAYACGRCTWELFVEDDDMRTGPAAFDAHHCEDFPLPPMPLLDSIRRNQ